MQTTDIALAAYLRLKGYTLKGIVPKEDNTFVFVFEDDDGIEKRVIEFVNSDFARFDAALRSLKKLIHNAKNQRRDNRQRP